jgi:prefoldin subunit 5
MQINSMQAGGNRYAQMQVRHLQAQQSQLSNQISMLQAQERQLTGAYNELNAQIKQLEARPDTKSDESSQPAVKRPVVSSFDRRDDYVKALGELRKQVDAVKEQYAALAEDAEVTAALATLNERSPKIKYVLGPSKKFLDTVKALEQAEAKGGADASFEESKPADTPKRKTKTAKKK